MNDRERVRVSTWARSEHEGQKKKKKSYGTDGPTNVKEVVITNILLRRNASCGLYEQ